MTHSFSKGIHRQMWVQLSPVPNAHAAGMGTACDLRNDLSRNPFIYQLVSAAILNRHNVITKSTWAVQTALGLAGTFGAGAGAVFAPSQALTGTVGTGSTTSVVVLSTALPTAVGVNMLANRGGSGDYGFKIRIILKATGKTEERWIIGNGFGSTISIRVDSVFSTAPQSGDTYEILSGRVFMLNAGTLAAGSWKSFEVATNTLATKTQTNLPTTVSTDFSAVALDELYVPFSNKPGEGFIKGTAQYNGTSLYCLQATASGASSLTGQASGGDSVIVANEYRNFQIRIVEDTGTPAAVGQRRIIASHTAGPSPVFTLGTAWATTPSATAKYVIEYPNLIILWTSAGTTTYTYNYGSASITNGTNTIAADAWSSTYFAARASAMGAGCTSFASFGIELDEDRYVRHSMIYSFRGGNTTTLDMLDISAATTGSFFSALVYDGVGPLFNTASCGKYAPFDNEGKFGYLNAYVASSINQIFRFDVKNRVLTPFTPTDLIQAGTATAGDRLGTIAVFDNTTPVTLVFLTSHLSTLTQELIVEV